MNYRQNIKNQRKARIKTSRRSSLNRKLQRGQVLVLFALMAIPLFGIIGIAIDSGHGYLSQRQSQTAGDAAALSGAQILSSKIQSGPPLSIADPSVVAALQTASLNGYTTVGAKNNGAPPANTYCQVTGGSGNFDFIFYDKPVSTATCPATSNAGSSIDNGPSGWTTAIEIKVPPAPGAQIKGPDCQKAPYNCMQVIISNKIPNFIEGIFGFNTTTVATLSTAYAKVGLGNINLPTSQSAITIYPPNAGAPNFDRLNPALTRQNLKCSANGVCPGFLNLAEGEIWGQDGNNAQVKGDYPAAIVGSDMVIGATIDFCDPYTPGGGTSYQCPSFGLPSSGSYTIGTSGFTINQSPAINLYCAASGNSPGTGLPGVPGGGTKTCTTTGPGGMTLGLLNGREGSNYSFPSWNAPAITAPTASCGHLILNGETISATGTTGCINPSDPYEIQPGVYDYIVINHGTYRFASGVYEIDKTAPVNNQASGTANGIDHRNETSADFDLCTGGTATSCPTLTSGVWIGHGGGPFTPGQPLTVPSCSGGSGTITNGGGGDRTNVSGFGVSFYFPNSANAGGFVSTHEVDHISLSAPPVGTSYQTSGIPYLFYLDNGSLIHLDAYQPNQNETTTNGFTGLIYQTPTPNTGGVEMDIQVGKYKSPVLTGQVIARSFTEFGDPNTSGVGVDFHVGWSSSFSGPSSQAGAYESSLLTPASVPILTSDGKGNAVFTVLYQDEVYMNAYQLYVSVNNGAPKYFSEGTWLNPATTSPVSPNTYAGQTGPSDSNPMYPSGAADPKGVYTKGAGNYGTKWTRTYSDGTTLSVDGSWTFGPQSDLNPPDVTTSKPAEVKYTLPITAGSNVKFTIYMVDGDGCGGDYALGTATFVNLGYPGAGTQVYGPGKIELEQ